MRLRFALGFASLTVALLVVVGPAPRTTAVEAPARRPLKLDDLDRLLAVADPQVSPDGQWVAYTVTRVEKEGTRTTPTSGW
jgi:hypothetical protein